MGSKKTTVQQGSTTVAPPTWTMPGIADASQRVTDAIAQIPKTTYQGNFQATPDAGLTQQTIDAYTGTAALAHALTGTQTAAIDGYNRNPGYDLSGRFASVLAPIQDQLTKTVLPMIHSSAMDSGAYSGSRANAILPALALNDFTRNSTNALADVDYQDWNAQQNRNLTWDQMLPQLISSALQTSAGQGDALNQAATVGQNADQAAINNAIAKQQASVTAPFQGLDIASELLRQLSGNYGTTSSNNTTTQTTGGLGNVVQGIAGLASLAGSFMSPVGGLSKLLGGATGAAQNIVKAGGQLS